jgi:hypothetical protein
MTEESVIEQIVKIKYSGCDYSATLTKTSLKKTINSTACAG